ncbi:MAG TPA: ubiquinol-cytochrome c reductase iron-sulfur subunit [Nitrospira sp.]|nr:ubiquinol-cytochrome c reductase iron-sulfur subunit [Nitrospira sp.]
MSSEPQASPASDCSGPVGTRRRFFEWVTGAIAGLIGVSLAVPLVGYVIYPAFRRRTQSWVDVAAVDELSVGKPKQLDYVATVHDGYLETKMQKAVWAIRQQGGQVTVFSPMCTHLGCGYHWDGEAQQFKCPCHGSVFDVSGRVVGGPAPRPLDALPSKVDNGRLLVMYKEFKSGVTGQVEL